MTKEQILEMQWWVTSGVLQQPLAGSVKKSLLQGRIDQVIDYLATLATGSADDCSHRVVLPPISGPSKAFEMQAWIDTNCSSPWCIRKGRGRKRYFASKSQPEAFAFKLRFG